MMYVVDGQPQDGHLRPCIDLRRQPLECLRNPGICGEVVRKVMLELTYKLDQRSFGSD